MSTRQRRHRRLTEARRDVAATVIAATVAAIVVPIIAALIG